MTRKLLIASVPTLALALLLIASPVLAQRQFILQTASGALTAATTTDAPATVFSTAIIFLDVTTITTPDAADQVDFYVQTTYDDGTTWTDVENINFTTADDGNTATRVIVIDGAKDGPGTLQSITGTNPAAAAEISETVPTDVRWNLISFATTLVTDANAANRQVSFTLDDGTTVYGRFHINTSITASQTVVIAFAPGLLRGGTATISVTSPAPIPTLLLAGHRIRTIVASIQAGDDWGAPQFLVEAWHDSRVSTDGTIGDNLKSYNRPLGSQIRIKTAVTDADADVVYAFSARGVFR